MQQAAIGAGGSFSCSFNTHALAVSGSPYTITYTYAGDANSNAAASDSSQTLAVAKATPAWSDLAGPSIGYGTASTTLAGTILDGVTPPTGSVSITLDGTTQQAAIGAGGSFSSSFDTQVLAVSGSPYTITYAYAGDANSSTASASSQTLTVSKATPAWSDLSGPSITYGTASTTLSGTIRGGTAIPTGNVSITLNGTTQQAAIGPGGSFSSSFDTHALAVSGSPYTITYTYAGDANSNAAVPASSQTLAVAKATPAWSDLAGASIAYGTASTTLAGTILDGATPPTGSVSITLNGERKRQRSAPAAVSRAPSTPRPWRSPGRRTRLPIPTRATPILMPPCPFPARRWRSPRRRPLGAICLGRRSSKVRPRQRFGDDPRWRNAADGQRLDYARWHDATGGDRRRRQFLLLLQHPGPDGFRLTVHDYLYLRGRCQFQFRVAEFKSDAHGHQGHARLEQSCPGRRSPMARLRQRCRGRSSAARRRQRAASRLRSTARRNRRRSAAVAVFRPPLTPTPWRSPARRTRLPTLTRATPTISPRRVRARRSRSPRPRPLGATFPGRRSPMARLRQRCRGRSSVAANAPDGQRLDYAQRHDATGGDRRRRQFLHLLERPGPGGLRVAVHDYLHLRGRRQLFAATNTSQTLTVTKATPAWSNLSGPSITYGTASATLSGTILGRATLPDGQHLDYAQRHDATGGDRPRRQFLVLLQYSGPGGLRLAVHDYVHLRGRRQLSRRHEHEPDAHGHQGHARLEQPFRAVDQLRHGHDNIVGDDPRWCIAPDGQRLDYAQRHDATSGDRRWWQFLYLLKHPAWPVSGSPYAITYIYAGDANYLAATNTSQTLTVTKATPTWSDLSGPSINYGTATTVLSGTILGGATTPTGSISITLNGTTQQAAIGAGDSFSTSFNTQALTVSGSPYAITYIYAGDDNYLAATNTSQTLTVTKATPTWSDLSGPSINYGTATTVLSGTILGGATTPTGSVSITLNGTTQQAAIGAGGSFSCSFNTQALAVSGSPYTITYAYAGDSNFASLTDTSKAVAVTPANASLSGYVFIDTNNSGQRMISAGVYKLGIPDVEVTLERSGQRLPCRPRSPKPTALTNLIRCRPATTRLWRPNRSSISAAARIRPETSAAKHRPMMSSARSCWPQGKRERNTTLANTFWRRAISPSGSPWLPRPQPRRPWRQGEFKRLRFRRRRPLLRLLRSPAPVWSTMC